VQGEVVILSFPVGVKLYVALCVSVVRAVGGPVGASAILLDI
jgi:hypothetical protein